MKDRWIVAVIGLPLLLAVLLACPAWATVMLIYAIAGIAAFELLHTAGKRIPPEVYVLTIAGAVLEILMIYCRRTFDFPEGLLCVVPWLLTVVLFFDAVRLYGTERAMPFTDLATALVGGVAFPLMFSCIFLLRWHPEFGRVYVLVPFFIAFAGDTLAMYFGMWFGKKKMAPKVSPNKTWAGFFGGILGSALGMVLLGLIGSKWLGYVPSYPKLLLVGVAGNLFGQLGDLSTSLIKREAGVKDYSRLFLEHGGMLDRFDSTMFIAPVAYFAMMLGLI